MTPKRQGQPGIMTASVYCPHCHKHTALSQPVIPCIGRYKEHQDHPVQWNSSPTEQWWIGICNACHQPCLVLNGGKIVMGVQVGDDTRYYGTINPFFYFAMLFNVVFTGIVFTYQPLGALAWAVVINAIGGRRWVDYRRVAAVGGMKV